MGLSCKHTLVVEGSGRSRSDPLCSGGARHADVRFFRGSAVSGPTARSRGRLSHRPRLGLNALGPLLWGAPELDAA
jgi:hypothetical protein